MDKEITPEMLDELEDMQEEQAEEHSLDQIENQSEFQEAYAAPEAEEKQNQHTFLHKAAFGSDDTVRTTFLNESELGRPLFNLRFLLDLTNISKYYIDPVIEEVKLNKITDNKIALYFWNKIQSITDSGMSNQGFAMTLNVTKRMDTIRKKVKQQSLDNLRKGMKGG